MTHAFLTRSAALAALALAAAGCTMKQQEAPPLSGPSEFGQSITVSVTPDVLQQDGRSQSVVTVTARGPNGAALPNLPLRAEIRVAGTPTDFGTLSARNLVTGSDGRASVVYTAPAAVDGPTVDPFTIVDIGITPIGSDFGNSATRFASLRLVPTGVVAPPDGLVPAFTVSPATPIDNQDVLFDASTSTAPANNPIVQFRWDFGDGDTDTGLTATHSFDTPGTYVVTLTVVDGFARSRSTSRTVTVSPGVNPVAVITASPTAPVVGQQVNFNGLSSVATPGQPIVGYLWDFGDGTPNLTGAQVGHTFSRAGTYVVTLVVTDSAGRKGTATAQVVVAP